MTYDIWGERDDVLSTLGRHNDIVRDLAEAHDGVVLVDQDRLMPRGARYFNDPSHLTVRGSVRFAEHLIDGIQPYKGENA
jgi:hypothetical protein